MVTGEISSVTMVTSTPGYMATLFELVPGAIAQQSGMVL